MPPEAPVIRAVEGGAFILGVKRLSRCEEAAAAQRACVLGGAGGTPPRQLRGRRRYLSQNHCLVQSFSSASTPARDSPVFLVASYHNHRAQCSGRESNPLAPGIKRHREGHRRTPKPLVQAC